MKEIIINKPKFNKNCFYCGEPVKITANETFYALVQKVDENMIRTIRIKYESPEFGSSGYKPVTYDIWLDKYQSGKIKIESLVEN